ncbi:MAG TPA: response regulator [Stenomitos sp.]
MTITDPTIRDQAYGFFRQESLDLLQTIEDGLLNLRSQYDIPHIHALMRAAHSIKGGASSVQLFGIQQIAHKLEDVFRALYRRTEPLDADLEEALLQAYDCLRLPLLEQLQTGTYDEAAAWAKAEPIFELLEAVLQLDTDAEVELPTAAELGVDIVHEVFVGDVHRGTQRLADLLQTPEMATLGAEIRATAEVFIGIGDLLGLPGFSAIAQVTIQALEHHPNQAVQIGQLAVACFEAAQVAVEAGDRTQGGTPSVELLNLAAGNTVAPESEHSNAIIPETESSLTELESLFSVAESAFVLETETLETLEEQAQPTLDFAHEEATDAQATEWETDASLPEPLPSSEATHTDLEDIFGASDLEMASLALEDWMEESATQLNDVLGSEQNTLESAPTDAAFASSATNSVPLQEPQPISTPQASSPATPTVELVSLSEAPVPEKPSPSPAKPASKPAAASETAYMTDSIRVDFNRLERLNNLVGELVTQENGALLQSQQLQARLKRLQQGFVKFEGISKSLQTWMDQSLKSDASQHPFLQPASQPSQQSSDLATLADFDPLLMDSYSNLYTIVQEALEEIAQMGESVGDMTLITQQAQQIQRKKNQTLKQVRNDLLWARMIPIGDVLNRFPRMVRDLSLKYKKQVQYKQFGTATLVDKAILERLYDPLVHLVRNAFDHGTETEAERLAQGKSAAATIEIRAYHQGNQTRIEVHDDGRGIDPEKIRAAALRQGLLTPETAATASVSQLYQCLFEPSFSTASTVSDLSGRGMGMSAVLNQVQALKGNITIASEIGQGTTFTISLPLTLTIAKLLVFSVDTYCMAIPVDTLEAIVAADDANIQTLQGQQFYQDGEQLIPLYPPSSFARHYPLPKGFSGNTRSMALPQQGKVPLLLISNGQEVIALEVDQVLDEQELVIKPFGKAGTPPSYLYGCAILGDGSLVPVIDGAVLITQWHASGSGEAPARIEPIATPLQRDIPTILVVDDSLTTRQNVTLTLQKFGYQVLQAGDGKEALDKLHQEPNIKAVVSDVEMPNMNGFEFLSACRKTRSPATLPIIMLTSRSSDKHRGIAKLLGANHYLTKPYLEQDLLKSLQTCLEEVPC